jgi:hypothetical protein
MDTASRLISRATPFKHREIAWQLHAGLAPISERSALPPPIERVEALDQSSCCNPVRAALSVNPIGILHCDRDWCGIRIKFRDAQLQPRLGHSTWRSMDTRLGRRRHWAQHATIKDVRTS